MNGFCPAFAPVRLCRPEQPVPWTLDIVRVTIDGNTLRLYSSRRHVYPRRPHTRLIRLRADSRPRALPLVHRQSATFRLIAASDRFRLSRCARVSRSLSFFRYCGSFLCSRRARVFRARSASRYSGSARLNLCNSLRLSRRRCRENAFCSSDSRGGAIHRSSRHRRVRSSPPPPPSTHTHVHTTGRLVYIVHKIMMKLGNKKGKKIRFTISRSRTMSEVKIPRFFTGGRGENTVSKQRCGGRSSRRGLRFHLFVYGRILIKHFRKRSNDIQ